MSYPDPCKTGQSTPPFLALDSTICAKHKKSRATPGFNLVDQVLPCSQGLDIPQHLPGMTGRLDGFIDLGDLAFLIDQV